MNTCTCLNGVYHHRTHVDGTFYQRPDLPAVLHVRNGCVLLSREDYATCVTGGLIRESLGGKAPKINIPHSIHGLPGYRTCPNAKSCPQYRGRKE